jgi:hypothetical protein
LRITAGRIVYICNARGTEERIEGRNEGRYKSIIEECVTKRNSPHVKEAIIPLGEAWKKNCSGIYL